MTQEQFLGQKPSAHNISPPILDEQGRLAALLDSSEAITQGYDITPVGDVGFVLRMGEHPVQAGNDWVFFDLDDTLIAYSQAKEARLGAYQEYAQERGLRLDGPTAEHVLEITDSFSRWNEGGEEMYHVDAHKTALFWATSELRDTDPETVEERLKGIGDQLVLVKTGLTEPVELGEDIPFHFEKNKLVLKETSAASEDIDKVFETMVKPPIYGDVLDVMTKIGGNTEDNLRPGLGIFTYGEPVFQLQKVLELMKAQAHEGRALPLAQIWLTKTPKGKFVEALSHPSGEGQTVDRKNQNEVLGDLPHVVLLVDDNPKELESLIQASQGLQEEFGVRFAAMRLRKEGTKTTKRDWNREFGDFARMLHQEGTVLDLATAIYFQLSTSRFLLEQTHASSFAQHKDTHPEFYIGKMNAERRLRVETDFMRRKLGSLPIKGS